MERTPNRSEKTRRNQVAAHGEEQRTVEAWRENPVEQFQEDEHQGEAEQKVWLFLFRQVPHPCP